MAVNFQFIDNSNHALLAFKAMQKLDFYIDSRGFVKYGKDNLYPAEIIRLYNEHPEHRAIINRKARYIFGKGIKSVDKKDELKVNSFIDSFNRKETLNEACKKIVINTELFNGVFVEVITNLKGEPIEFYFLNSANCRLSEDKETLFFCKSWSKGMRLDNVKEVKRFNKNEKQVGTFFIDFSYYTPSANYLETIYPKPQYQGVIDDINTDIDISTFNKNYVSNGFSVGTIISFFNGIPDDAMKRDIDNRFNKTYAGEEGSNILITHTDQGGQAPTVTTIGVEELATKFEFTSKRALKKIFAGHEMSSELFNIKFDDSFLSSSPDLITLQDLFVKGYVEPRQTELLEFLSYLSYLKTGEYLKMEFEPISLIGVDLSNDQDLTIEERRLIKGYEPLSTKVKPISQAVNDAINSLSPLVANKVLESMSEDEIRGLASLPPKNTTVDSLGNVIETPVKASVNDTLTNLTGRQLQGLLRIVSKYDAGKLNKEAAILTMMQGYGLTREDALTFLDENDNNVLETKLSSQVDKVLMALEACAEDDNDDDILLIEAAHIHNSKDALKYEMKMMKFADTLILNVTELDSSVLNALKGNPTLTVDDLASELKYDGLKISESIARLNKKGLINNTVDGFIPTKKALDKKTEPIKELEVYTVYKYDVNPLKPSLSAGGSSRPFCKKLMSLSKTKSWTFEKLDSMENDLGTNVWDYRGGYYTNPDTGIVDPDCRHLWMAITKTRIKKK